MIANEENRLKDAKDRKGALDIFKKDLGTFSRFYEFISQIVAFDDKELEMLNLYARTIANKVQENEAVMSQVNNNTAEQTMLGMIGYPSRQSNFGLHHFHLNL